MADTKNRVLQDTKLETMKPVNLYLCYQDQEHQRPLSCKHQRLQTAEVIQSNSIQSSENKHVNQTEFLEYIDCKIIKATIFVKLHKSIKFCSTVNNHSILKYSGVILDRFSCTMFQCLPSQFIHSFHPPNKPVSCQVLFTT